MRTIRQWFTDTFGWPKPEPNKRTRTGASGSEFDSIEDAKMDCHPMGQVHYFPPGDIAVSNNNIFIGEKDHKMRAYWVDGEGSHLIYKGVLYDLSEWLSTPAYAKAHRLNSTSLISTWIRRGRIQPEDYLNIPELNDLRLVRDKSYKKEVE